MKKKEFRNQRGKAYLPDDEEEEDEEVSESQSFKRKKEEDEEEEEDDIQEDDDFRAQRRDFMQGRKTAQDPKAKPGQGKA